VATFEIYADVDGINGLADTQQAYRQRFQALMEQVEAQAQTTVSQWEGSGSDQFKTSADRYHQHFAQVQAAFAKLIGATGEAATSYASLWRYLVNQGTFVRIPRVNPDLWRR
jgi:WXG100 family type VII secretion target